MTTEHRGNGNDRTQKPPPRRVRRQIEQRRRAEARRARRSREWGVGMTYAVALDGDDAEAIEEAKKQTHDSLIRMLGLRRRSGVSWLFFEGHEGVSKLLEIEAKMRQGHGERTSDPTTTATEAAAVTVETLLAALHEHPKSVLVIAIADAVDA